MTDKAAKVVSTLIHHLKAQDQLALLPQVVELLMRTSEYRKAANRVVVTSAVKLDAGELKRLNNFVNKQLAAPYILINEVDESLVAGFTLQINDTFLDASLLGKLNILQNKLT